MVYGGIMRININLNKYFDNMQPDDVSRLWSMMLDFKHRERSMSYLLETGFPDRSDEDQKKIKELAVFNMVSDTRAIDRFMVSVGQESLFGTENKRWLTDEEIVEIIDRYNYLMARPE